MKRAKGPGRPKTPRKIAKSALLSVRFSESERKALDAAASGRGLKLSEWAREALINAANQDHRAIP